MSDLGVWVAAIPGRQMATWNDMKWGAVMVGSAAILIFGGAAVRQWRNRRHSGRH